MKIKILTTLFLCLIAQFLLAQTTKDTLYVYGPGGPFAPFNECAVLFAEMNNISVKVIAGPEKSWIVKAETDADIIYGGAEYMLTDFIGNYPNLIELSTRTSLYQRSFAILVRPNNPKNIRSVKDLANNNIKILDINGAGQVGVWEDIAGRKGLIAAFQKNIGTSYKNTALGIEGWKDDATFDAWITYASWHYRLKDITDLVSIPVKDNLSRGTPVAVTSKGMQSEYAMKFIEFMKSSKGHEVFKKWGWD